MEYNDVENEHTVKGEVATSEKMLTIVTFMLGGRLFGINIFKMKGISRENQFTTFPNTPHFVRGVYNLRGEIISVIDLRKFFNLDYEEIYNNDGDATYNVIFLDLEDYQIGVVVDSIEHTLSIPPEKQHVPSQIFAADFNIHYLETIVENEKDLVLVLNVDVMLGANAEALNNVNYSSIEEIRQAEEANPGIFQKEVKKKRGFKTVEEILKYDPDMKITIDNFRELSDFYITDFNSEWFINWYNRARESGEKTLLKENAEIERVLKQFLSAYTGNFWTTDFSNEISEYLPEKKSGNYNVWNPGCGEGFEAVSLACLIDKKSPEVYLSIIAQDNNLLEVSNAIGLKADPKKVSGLYKPYLKDPNKKSSFNDKVKDAAIFEYHDITSETELPELDVIFARDVFSFLAPEGVEKIKKMLNTSINRGTVIILGENERFSSDDWESFSGDGFSVYRKK